jgi:uncharacterized protein YggU (UPF0235/DUF167 family)
MAEKKVTIHSGGRGTALAIQIHPGAGSHRIENVDFANGSVLIGLRCSASQSEINSQLVVFLAKVLDVYPDQIEIVAGQGQNKKLISILDIKPDEVQTKLMENLQGV